MQQGKLPPSRLKLSFEPFQLQLKHVFTLAGSSRSSTPIILTKIEFEGITGYGEASMPPYLGESQKTASQFLMNLNLEQFSDPLKIDEILEYVDQLKPGNAAAKASVDIALHDLVGKMIGEPWYKIWKLSPENTPYTSYTIGIDSKDMIQQKVREASEFKILKVKLGRDNDKEIINAIREISDVPLCVDINQGWKDKNLALEMIYWLQENGVEYIEQPLLKEKMNEIEWLTNKSPLPIIADEGVQRFTDIQKIAGVYSGINIKLMKCTGMHEAHKMIKLARANNMKVMIGCMTETSCGISAAAQLSPLADWADLDGNLLISNDPYSGIKITDGKITLIDKPGIGISIL